MADLRKKALIVEGDRLTGRELAAVLKGAGFDVVEVTTHEDPLLQAELERPQVILLDMTSEKVDGFAVFKAIRDSHVTNKIPIIAITGGGQRNGVNCTQDDFEAAIDALGPEATLDKPIDARSLVTCVLGLLG